MRTFHIGGTASKVVEQTVLASKHDGTIKFLSFDAKKNADFIIPIWRKDSTKGLGCNGTQWEVAVIDETGRSEKNIRWCMEEK